MGKLNPYAKAIAGAIVAALNAYTFAVSGDGQVTAAEWAGVAVAFITTLGAVWAVTNTPAKPDAETHEMTISTSSTEPLQPPDDVSPTVRRSGY